MSATDRNGRPCEVGCMVRFFYRGYLGRGILGRGMIIAVDEDNPGCLKVQTAAPPGIENATYNLTCDDVEVEG